MFHLSGFAVVVVSVIIASEGVENFSTSKLKTLLQKFRTPSVVVVVTTVVGAIVVVPSPQTKSHEVKSGLQEITQGTSGS